MSVTIGAARAADAEHVLKLQYLCFQDEAVRYGDWGIAPLTETLEELRAGLAAGCCVVARLGEEVVGAVRAEVDAQGTARIGRLCVHPRLRGHGLGARLLARVEDDLARERAVTAYRLFTGRRSEGNLRLYRRCGYVPVGTAFEAGPTGRKIEMVTLEKPVPAVRAA